jgi:hypothetical protein
LVYEANQLDVLVRLSTYFLDIYACSDQILGKRTSVHPITLLGEKSETSKSGFGEKRKKEREREIDQVVI